MPRLKITKANVKEIVKPVSGQVDYFDTELSGFGVRATKETLTFLYVPDSAAPTRSRLFPLVSLDSLQPNRREQLLKNICSALLQVMILTRTDRNNCLH